MDICMWFIAGTGVANCYPGWGWTKSSTFTPKDCRHRLALIWRKTPPVLLRIKRGNRRRPCSTPTKRFAAPLPRILLVSKTFSII